MFAIVLEVQEEVQDGIDVHREIKEDTQKIIRGASNCC